MLYNNVNIFMFRMIYLASQTWHLVSQGGMVDGPPPRHRHSAVLHNNALWVFGGMTDLQERSDFWRFDFGKYRLLHNFMKPMIQRAN